MKMNSPQINASQNPSEMMQQSDNDKLHAKVHSQKKAEAQVGLDAQRKATFLASQQKTRPHPGMK